MYDPKVTKFPYPENTDEHYLEVKEIYHHKFDENYPYIDNRKSFRFKQFLLRVLLYIIVFPFMRIRMGLRVKGRKNLRKQKDIINSGVISVSNHIHMFDYLAVMYAIRPVKSNVLVWTKNMQGKNYSSIRLVGGIPIPDESLKGTKAYINTLENRLNNKGWIHIYSEGSMWEGYALIRPFKKGASFFSCKFDKPILPLAFSYRKPNWIRRVIFHQFACYTLTIGDFLYPNKELTGKEQVNDLTKRCHDEVCKLAGIDPNENIYPPLFDNNKRVDYYANEYGKGYKGSW